MFFSRAILGAFCIFIFAMTSPLGAQEEGPLIAACDFCLPASVPGGPVEALFQPGFQAGVSHQYTRFGRLTQDGASVTNPLGERINSNSTQIHLTYNFDPRVGVQLSIPYHDRSYVRQQGQGTERGNVSGLGDIVLRGRFVPKSHFSTDRTFIWTLDAGLKLPTGSSSRLRPHTHEPSNSGAAGHEKSGGHDEHQHGKDHDHDGEEHHHHRQGYLAHEGHDHGDGHQDEMPANTEIPHHSAGSTHLHNTAVHDHDLALGSGSVDGVFGTGLFFRQGDFYANAGAQYFLRSTGSFAYRFGDVLHWRLAPGYLVLNNDKQVLGLQLNLSGEHHAPHSQDGAPTHHRYTDIVWLGPEVMFGRGENLLLNAGMDFPAKFHSEGLQLAPEYRIRGNLNWRF